jgi:transcriptional regulator with XRE-family HTH domain
MASHFIFLASAGQAEGRASVKKTSRYGERDYAFGQAMLTLRTSIGLTQAVLADLLQVSRRAEWEAGSSYPKAGNLKQIIALEVQQQAFASGREVEEIHALWKAGHQVDASGRRAGFPQVGNRLNQGEGGRHAQAARTSDRSAIQSPGRRFHFVLHA